MQARCLAAVSAAWKQEWPVGDSPLSMSGSIINPLPAAAHVSPPEMETLRSILDQIPNS